MMDADQLQPHQPTPFPDHQTVWDAITQAYPYIATLSRPQDEPFRSILDLPACNLLMDNPLMDPLLSPPIQHFYQGAPDLKRKVLAACVQASGDELYGDKKCQRCNKGDGVWDVCVTAPIIPGPQGDVLDGSCASCYFDGQVCNTCSFALDAAFAPTYASGPMVPGNAPLPSNLPAAPGQAATRPANVLLVAYYRSMSKALRESARTQLLSTQAFVHGQLDAVRSAEKEAGDEDSASSIFVDPVLTAYYRAMSKVKRADTRVGLEESLAQVQTHLTALAAVGVGVEVEHCTPH
ncbi:hypothetical protein F4776DRAFT_667415 [Hypoxylon sp. NC0597]|nr:hypothetical protein F4776DRAFT_667415 [Hypoxylon sp. NC0597]